MNWYPPYRTGSDPRQPDKEEIYIDHVIERSYDLAAHSLQNEIHAEDVSLVVAKRSYDFDRPRKSTPFSLRPHKPRQNRATMIDLATYDAMERYKKRWVDDSHRSLPAATVDRWYLEAMIEYVIAHQAIFVAVGIGNVLFSYNNTEVQRVFERLDANFVFTKAKHKDGDFRQKKTFILERLKPKNGKQKRCVSSFLTLQESKHENDPKRFVARANSSQNFKFAAEALDHLTPIEPECPFPHEFYDGSFDVYEKDLEVYVKRKDRYHTSDGVDRVRKHVLLHPKCWVPIYRKLKLEEPERKIEMPDYSSYPRVDLAPPTQMGRSEMQMSAELKERVGKRAEEWNRDRKNFAARSVTVLINDQNRQRISVTGPETASAIFALEDGENFIELYGENQEGNTILLGSYFVPWDKDEIGTRPVRYVTELVGSRLNLSIKYDWDEFGNPTGAVATLNHIPRRGLFGWTGGLTDFVPAHRWPVIGTATAATLLVLAGLTAISRHWSKPVANPSSRSAEITTPPDSHSTKAAGIAAEKSGQASPSAEIYAAEHQGKVPGKPGRGELRRQRRSGGDRYTKESKLRDDRSKLKKQQLANNGSWLRRPIDKAVKLGKSVATETGKAIKKGTGNLLKGIGNLISQTKSGKPGAGSKAAAVKEIPFEFTSSSPVFASAENQPIHIIYPPPPATPAVTTLTGIVTDLDDRPIPFAIVLFRARKPNLRPSSEISSGQVAVVCDGQGEFRVRYTTGEIYDLMAEQNGFAPASKMGIKVSRETASAPRVHIKLQPERVPEDRLIDRAGSHRQGGPVDSFN